MLKKVRKFLGKCKYLLIILISKINYAFLYKKNSYKILDDEDTVNEIIKNNKSLSRFGDGEFKWMLGVKQVSFQENDEELQKGLFDVINNQNEKLIIGIPRALNSLSNLNRNAKKEWKLFILFYYNSIKKYINKKNIYADTNITRFYIDYIDKSECLHKIKNIKRIWNNREIIIIEGKKTKLGVGNNLFDNVKSLSRILAPSENAFKSYNKILDFAKKQEKDKLFILSLGPTATILASDLSKSGFQAIDIGHIDIEYEWFLMKANSKVPVKGKYVNEARNKGDLSDDNIESEEYRKSIIKIID